MHVGIVMGSDSDLPVMKKAFAILDDFGVTYDVTIASAHRTPKKLADFVAAEEKKGVGAFIAGAGMAAALPGVVASLTLKPVIGCLCPVLNWTAWMPCFLSCRCLPEFRWPR